jgi:hypothetical protein
MFHLEASRRSTIFRRYLVLKMPGPAERYMVLVNDFICDSQHIESLIIIIFFLMVYGDSLTSLNILSFY